MNSTLGFNLCLSALVLVCAGATGLLVQRLTDTAAAEPCDQPAAAPAPPTVGGGRAGLWAASGVILTAAGVAAALVKRARAGSPAVPATQDDRAVPEGAATALAHAPEFRPVVPLELTVLANMSHELRTPLNAVLGYTGTLLMKLPGPLNAAQEKQLRRVQDSGRLLLGLINDVLELARIDAGKVKLEREPVDCRGVLVEIDSALRPIAQERGLSLVVSPPSVPLTVLADRRALGQILHTLAANAVRFAEQGEVRISVTPPPGPGGSVARFVVAATHSALTPQELAALLDAFAAPGMKVRRREEGAALGLYLSRRLAGLHGGQITVESPAGAATAFVLTLGIGGA